MRKSLAAFCLEKGLQELLGQWDQERNAPLTPETISYGSKRKVWWRCSKGHEWLAPPYARTGSETGCPYCAGKLPIPGETDLGTLFPNLTREWHPTKNGSLTPDQVLPGSHQKVWWRCANGHDWMAQVKSRVSGCGCPVCANKIVEPARTDLATVAPAVAAQWHPAKNGPLTPDQVTPSSNRKVWWRCERGHDYPAWIAGRTRQGSGCPYCAGTKVLPGFNDLATRVPQIAAQWHPTFNGALTPSMVTPGSHRKVWWQCSEGHVWKAVVHSRAGPQKCGCPVCAGVSPRRRNTRDIRPALEAR